MRTLLVLAGLLGGAAPVAAQTPTETTTPASRFEEEVVVTASLEEETRSELSASVQVIEASEIEARQATNVADLLKTVPGLDVLTSGSAGKVTSLFSRGTESDHTLALWNGVELNNPFFGGFDWAVLPTDGVRRIEVVRGPFSALYGSDALGGVIQVLTGSPIGSSAGASVRGAARLEAGDRGYRRLSFDARSEGKKTRIEAMGHLREGDGEMENDFFDSRELALSGQWSPSEALRFSLVARANESETGIPFSGGLPSPQREITWSERQVAVPVSYRRGAWELSGQISHVSYSTAFSDPEDAFGFTSSTTDSESGRVRATAVRRRSEGTWIAFGGEVERLRVDDRSVFGVNLDGARQSTRSVFAQAVETFGSARVDLGLRFDDNDVFGSRTTPKVGLVMPFGERTKIRASWGQGFRAPSIGELFYPFSGTSTLEPEESESWETGVEYSSSAWQLGATVFENDLVNLIDFDFVTFTNRNVGRARSRGLETWARYSAPRWSVTAGATLLDSEDLETGEALLRRPEESGSLVLRAEPGVWDLSVTAAFVGSRQDIDPTTFGRVTLGSHVRLDVAARYEGRDKLEPYARVENLADREYEEVAGYAAPSRRLIVGLASKWK